MSRLVRYATMGDSPVELTASNLDPLAAYGWDVQAFANAQHEAGRQDGMRIGYELAMADQHQLATIVQQAVAAAVVEMQRVRSVDAQAVVVLALEIARTVLGHEPSDGGVAIARRVRDAMAVVDDRPLVLSAHPDDAQRLRDALSDVDGLDLVADASITPGDARLQGRWSSAEINRSAAWKAVERTLGQGA